MKEGKESYKGKKGLKLVITNIDGFIIKKTELIDYSKENNLDILCIVQTKLVKNLDMC